MATEGSTCPSGREETAAVALRPHRLCCWLVSEAFRPRGESKHSLFRKTRFALSLFSPYLMMGVVGGAKDIYLEKFGLDATAMAFITTVISFWAAFQEVLMGHLQDRWALARCFRGEAWGRRAPWLLTHGCLGIAGAGLINLPPDGNLVYVWFAVASVTVSWSICACLIAFQSSRQELYPYNEERLVVEALCKYACMAGGGVSGVVFAILSINASMQIRLAIAPCIVALGAISLQSVPIMKETRFSLAGTDDTRKPGARSPDELHIAGSPAAAPPNSLGIFWEALPLGIRLLLRRLQGVCCSRGAQGEERPNNRALQHLLAIKWWHGTYAIIHTNMLIYYITYVLRLSSWKRVQTMAGAMVAAGALEFVMSLLYVRLFATGDGRTDETGYRDQWLLRVVVGQRLANAMLTSLLLGALQPTVGLLFLWTITMRINLSSFSFWRISAQCWLVDEDCFGGCARATSPRGTSNRRQGVIFGALSMSQTLAVALSGSLLLLGLGLAGFQTKNCEAACRLPGGMAVPTAKNDTPCVDVCFRGVINGQPESLRLYIRLAMGVLAPLCEILVALHTYLFPIKGARLRQVYALVAERLANTGQSGGIIDEAGMSQAPTLFGKMLEEDPVGHCSTWQGADQRGWPFGMSAANMAEDRPSPKAKDGSGASPAQQGRAPQLDPYPPIAMHQTDSNRPHLLSFILRICWP